MFEKKLYRYIRPIDDGLRDALLIETSQKRVISKIINLARLSCPLSRDYSKFSPKSVFEKVIAIPYLDLTQDEAHNLALFEQSELEQQTQIPTQS